MTPRLTEGSACPRAGSCAARARAGAMALPWAGLGRTDWPTNRMTGASHD